MVDPSSYAVMVKYRVIVHMCPTPLQPIPHHLSQLLTFEQDTLALTYVSFDVPGVGVETAVVESLFKAFRLKSLPQAGL